MNTEQFLVLVIKKHYRAVAACFILLTFACAFVADFRVEQSIDSWIDKDSQDYLRYRKMLDEFGDDATLIVVFDRTDLTAANLAAYQSFIENIKARKEVSVVFDPVGMFLLGLDGDSLDADVIDDFKISFSDKPSDYRNVLMSTDMSTLAVLILLKQKYEYLQPQLISEVEKNTARIGLHAHFAGTSYFSDILSKTLTRDLTVIISGLSVIAFLILLWFLRSPSVVFSIVAGIAASLTGTVALMSSMGIKLNLLALILYPLVLCIAITASIHLFSRRDHGVWHLENAYKKIFNPTIITMITTVIGCSAFAFAPQSVVRDMGLVFPAAIVITCLVSLLFVPSVFLCLAGKRELPSLATPLITGRSTRHQIFISILLLLAALLAITQLPKLRTEADAICFFAPDSDLIQSYKYIENHLAGLLVMDMIVETNNKSAVTTQQNVEQIRSFIHAARRLPELTTITSPLDWLNAFTPDTVSPELEQAYLSEDRSSMRITFRFRNISGLAYSSNISMLKKLWSEHNHAGLTMHVTGLLPLILEAQDALLKTQALVFPVILILMTLVLALIIRSPIVLLSACLANLVPLLIMAGAMVVLDIPVNSINLFVVSVMLGVIVDDTIHLLYAWKNTDSIETALHEVRPALWITTLTITLAFSCLLFSSLRPIAQFGLLSIIAIIVAYLCDVYLLPCLLGQRRLRHE